MKQAKLTTWLLCLLRDGHVDELLALDSAARSKLGSTVESKMRCLQIIGDYQKSQGIFAGDWKSTEVVRDGVMALVHVNTAFASSDLASAAVPHLDETQKALGELASGRMASLQKEMRDLKISMLPLCQESENVTKEIFGPASVPSELGAETKAIIAKHNRADNPEMKSFVEGHYGDVLLLLSLGRIFQFFNVPNISLHFYSVKLKGL